MLRYYSGGGAATDLSTSVAGRHYDDPVLVKPGAGPKSRLYPEYVLLNQRILPLEVQEPAVAPRELLLARSAR